MAKRKYTPEEAREAVNELQMTARSYARQLPEGQIPMTKEAIQDFTDTSGGLDFKGMRGKEGHINSINLVDYSRHIFNTRKPVEIVRDATTLKIILASKVHQARQAHDKLEENAEQILARINERRTYDRQVAANGLLTDAKMPREDDNKARRIQQVFATEYERIMGLENDEAKLVIIDPRYISTSLLDRIGLPTPSKGSSSHEKLEFKANLIPELKELLASLQPLTDSDGKPNYRVYYIGSGPKRGHLLKTVSRMETKTLRRLHFQRLSASAAPRQTVCVDNSINRERADMAALGTIMLQLDAFCEQKQAELNKDIEAGKGQHLDNYRRLVLEGIKIVDGSTDDVKKEILGLLVELNEVKQKVKVRSKEVTRSALPSLKAKRVAINTRIKQRLAGVERISKIMQGKDKTIYDAKVASHEAPFKQFEKDLNRHEDFTIYRENVIELAKDDPVRIARIADNIELMIVAPMKELLKGELCLEPWASIASKMIEQGEYCVNCLRSPEDEDIAKSQAEFTKLYLILKLRHYYSKFLRVYTKHLSDSSPGFRMAEANFDWRYELDRFMNKRVAPTVKTPEYDEHWKQFVSMLKNVAAVLREAAELETNGENDDFVKNMKQEAKDIFLQFDLGTFIASLPVGD